MENLIYAAIFVGLTIAFLGIGGWYFFIWYVIIKMPTIPIAESVRKFAEIKGHVLPPGKEILSPINQVPCSYYIVKVQEMGGGHSNSWVTIHQKSSTETMVIADGSGETAVSMGAAEAMFNEDFTARSATLWDRDFPGPVLLYMKNNRIKKSKTWGLDRPMRVVETYIKPGEEVYVLGWGARTTHGIRFIKKGLYPLLVSDMSESRVARQYLLFWILSVFTTLAVMFFLFLPEIG